jgi:hypothetical protein
MGHLIIPTEREIAGPWFLGNSELEELDDVFGFIDAEMIKAFDVEIEEEANEMIKSRTTTELASTITRLKARSYIRNAKKVTLISKDEKRLIDNSLRGILKDSKIKDFKPKELRLEIEHGNNELSIIIKKVFDDKLSYKVKCSSQDSQEEIRYKLDNLLEKHRPNKFKQIWTKYAYYIGLLSFIFILTSFSIYVLKDSTDVKSTYQNEINTLLKSGVTNDNQNKAIELLLKYSSDYRPENIRNNSIFDKSFYRMFSISIFVLLISIFHPKTVIGIGRDRNLQNFYRFYTAFVLFTIPSIFIIPPIIDFIKRFINP